MGFDGSRDAARAIAVGAGVLPGVQATVVTVWAPPWGDPVLRRRVSRRARTLDQLGELMEQESAAAAVAADGAALAVAAGWTPDATTHRAYGDPGFVLAHLAAEQQPAAVVVGSRGLSGTGAALGSVADLTVHHSPVPVLVVPPVLSGARAAAATGPVLVAHDGSPSAEHARTTAAALLPGRDVVVAHVDAEHGAGSVPPEAVTLHPHGWGARGVADALEADAESRGAGVVVVGSRGRSTLRELVLGSTVLALLHHAALPVLVVPTRVGGGETSMA